MTVTTRTPVVLWAQRKDRLFLTIDLHDATAPVVELSDDGVLKMTTTAGAPGVEGRHEYHLELEFLHPIDAKASKISVAPRQIVVMVMKTEEHSGPHWPRLLKANGKFPHVKTDFDKWVDEDEEDELDRDAAFDLSKLKDLSMYDDSAENFCAEPDSDDDDDLPDLEKV